MSLDYGPLYALMERQELSKADWNDLFADVTVIEAAAVSAINAKNKQ